MKYLAKILAWFFKWMYENKRPDFIIKLDKDVEYLHRWWVIPRNHYFNIYLHKVVADDERFFHDHPWKSIGFILEGTYTEIIPYEQQFHRIRNRKLTQTAFHLEVLKQGNIKYRDIHYAHYLLLGDVQNPPFNKRPIPTWSLFITGPKKRDWGFYDQQGNWESHIKWCADRGREVTY